MPSLFTCDLELESQLGPHRCLTFINLTLSHNIIFSPELLSSSGYHQRGLNYTITTCHRRVIGPLACRFLSLTQSCLWYTLFI